MKLKTLPIFFAFLCMGFGDAVNSFVGIAKEKFTLDNFEANLIAFAGYIMFGLLSVPMGVCMDKIGKKNTLMSGLILEVLGVALVLVLGVNEFTIFLIAILLLGAGSTILQVSGNPIMRDVSDEGQYSSNLSMGQFVKAIGSFTAPAVFTIAALKGYTEKECWPVLLPIFAVAILISIVSVATLKIREKEAEAKSASLGSCLALLANPFVFVMVLGIFLYVGAEVCMASGLPVYFKAKFGFTPELATQFVTYFFIAIMIGRFFGAMILKRVAPKTFLVAASVFSLLGFVLLALGSHEIVSISKDGEFWGVVLLDSGSAGLSIAALFMIALGFANIFPLIFSITIDKMPEKSSELSGLMITAICGGAFIPLLMGKLADIFGNLAGFVVPALCLVYILTAGISVKTVKNS